MPLPSVQGYLLGTREPLDYVGKAIDAFTQVSAEFRATRAQNLAEQKDARQAGQEMKQGLQDDRMFQEDLIDKDLNRRLAIDDQAIQREKLGLEIQQFEMERDYIAPLKQDLLQAQIESNQALAESRRFGVESKRTLQNQFRNEANEFNRELSTLESGPQIDPEGRGPTQESVDQYYDKVRNINRKLGEMKPTWGDDPAAKQFLGAAEARLSRIPAFRYLQANDDLKTPEERTAIQGHRQTMMDSMLPFASDSDRARWMQSNQTRIGSWMKLPNEAFTTVLKNEASRLSENPDYNPAKQAIAPTRNVFQSATQSDRDLLLKRNTAALSGKTGIRLIDDTDAPETPLSAIDMILRGIGFNDTQLEPVREVLPDGTVRTPSNTGNEGIPRATFSPAGTSAPDREGAARSLFSNPP